MHTIQQIIDNQKVYRKEILRWFTDDLKETKDDLLSIDTEDEYIQDQVDKLKKTFKRAKYKKEIDRLFFLHPKRNEEFYVWWDSEGAEAVILSYGKK